MIYESLFLNSSCCFLICPSPCQYLTPAHSNLNFCPPLSGVGPPFPHKWSLFCICTLYMYATVCERKMKYLSLFPFPLILSPLPFGIFFHIVSLSAYMSFFEPRYDRKHDYLSFIVWFVLLNVKVTSRFIHFLHIDIILLCGSLYVCTPFSLSIIRLWT